MKHPQAFYPPQKSKKLTINYYSLVVWGAFILFFVMLFNGCVEFQTN